MLVDENVDFAFTALHCGTSRFYQNALLSSCRLIWPLSYTIYLEIVLSAAECPQKHGGCDVTGVNLGYDVHAVIH